MPYWLWQYCPFKFSVNKVGFGWIDTLLSNGSGIIGLIDFCSFLFLMRRAVIGISHLKQNNGVGSLVCILTDHVLCVSWTQCLTAECTQVSQKYNFCALKTKTYDSFRIASPYFTFSENDVLCFIYRDYRLTTIIADVYFMTKHGIIICRCLINDFVINLRAVHFSYILGIK